MVHISVVREGRRRVNRSMVRFLFGWLCHGHRLDRSSCSTNFLLDKLRHLLDKLGRLRLWWHWRLLSGHFWCRRRGRRWRSLSLVQRQGIRLLLWLLLLRQVLVVDIILFHRRMVHWQHIVSNRSVIGSVCLVNLHGRGNHLHRR